MVQRRITLLEDDIDGSEAAETVLFGIDGVNYEIDLNAEHAEELRQALDTWIKSGRRVGGRKVIAKNNTKPGRANEIRAWAAQQGYQVNPRGRVASNIVAAYEAAIQN